MCLHQTDTLPKFEYLLASPQGTIGSETSMRLAAKISLCLLVSSLLAIPARSAGIVLSPDAAKALDQIYNGDTDAAVATARGIEQAQPDSPVGYLLEDEAQWWKMYCVACEIKW